MSKRMNIASLALIALTISACSNPTQEKVQEAESAVRALTADAQVTELLPIGPHTVRLEVSFDTYEGEHSVLAEGYIDLGEGQYGEDCTMDLKFTETRSQGESTFLTRRAIGQSAYHRLSASTHPEHINEVGTWVEVRNSAQVPTPMVLFSPSYISDLTPVVPEGVGSFCSWRLLDLAASLTDPTTGKIAWEKDSLGILKRGLLAYIVDDLVGSVQTAGEVLDEEWATDVPDSLFADLYIEKDERSGVITMRNMFDTFDTFTAVATFTPTEPREVDLVPTTVESSTR